jgi:hypothetical protein
MLIHWFDSWCLACDQDNLAHLALEQLAVGVAWQGDMAEREGPVSYD